MQYTVFREDLDQSLLCKCNQFNLPKSVQHTFFGDLVQSLQCNQFNLPKSVEHTVFREDLNQSPLCNQFNRLKRVQHIVFKEDLDQSPLCNQINLLKRVQHTVFKEDLNQSQLRNQFDLLKSVHACSTLFSVKISTNLHCVTNSIYWRVCCTLFSGKILTSLHCVTSSIYYRVCSTLFSGKILTSLYCVTSSVYWRLCSTLFSGKISTSLHCVTSSIYWRVCSTLINTDSSPGRHSCLSSCPPPPPHLQVHCLWVSQNKSLNHKNIRQTLPGSRNPAPPSSDQSLCLHMTDTRSHSVWFVQSHGSWRSRGHQSVDELAWQTPWAVWFEKKMKLLLIFHTWTEWYGCESVSQAVTSITECISSPHIFLS